MAPVFRLMAAMAWTALNRQGDLFRLDVPHGREYRKQIAKAQEHVVHHRNRLGEQFPARFLCTEGITIGFRCSRPRQ